MLSFMRENAKKILIITIAFFVGSIIAMSIQTSISGRNQKKEKQKTEGQVATVDGREINGAYLTRNYSALLTNYKGKYQKDPVDPKINRDIQYYSLMKTIEFEKYLLLAKERKIKVKNKEVKQQLTEIRKAYNLKNKKALQALLAQNGYKYDDFIKLLKAEMTVAKLIQDTRNSVTVSDADVLNRYKKVKAKHILCSSMPLDENDKRSAEERKKEARKRIAEVYDKLVAGAKFEDLAAEYSDDPGSKVNGGSLGVFGAGVMVPEFEKEAFALKAGEYSKPFATMFGFHIVAVDEVIDGEVPLNVDEKEEKQKILQERQQAAMQQLNLAAQNIAETEIFLPMFKAYEHLSKGELEQAEGVYQLLASQNPQSSIPLIFTAEVYEMQGRKEEALAEYKKGLLIEKMYPQSKNPFFHFYLGQYYAAAKKNAEAAAEFKVAEELTTDNLEFLKKIQEAYKKIGYTTTAAKVGLKIKAVENAVKLAEEKEKEVEFASTPTENKN